VVRGKIPCVSFKFRITAFFLISLILFSECAILRAGELIMSNNQKGIHATFTRAHIWVIIAAIIVFAFVALWRVDRAINNGMFHIYTAVQTTNNNVKNLGTALQNHPVTKDLIYTWDDIPPLHMK
jgi:hypothetical protein